LTERTMLPLVPLIVSVYVPAATLLFDAIASAAVPEPDRVEGLNFAVAKRGAPWTVSAMLPENPDPAATVTE
jgi:hypothetical protein